MENDELAEFNGIKPNYLLKEGEAKEVQSKTSDVKYDVKRTSDHFYCTCPAWRNQSGVPVNARSCKHLLSLLGEAYEEARLEAKNPGGPPPKGLPVRKSKSKVTGRVPEVSKLVSTTTKKEEADDRMDVDEDEDGEVKKKPTLNKKPASSAKTKSPTKRKRAAEDSEEDEGEQGSKSKSAKAKRPVKRKKEAWETEDEDDDEEEKSQKPQSKSKGKKPSSSKGRTPAQRSKKDASETEEEDEEEEEKPNSTSKSKKPPSSKGKVSAKRSRRDASETEEEDEEEEKPKSKFKSKKPPSSKGKTPAKRSRKDVSESEEETESKKPSKKPASKPASKRRKAEEDEPEDEPEDEQANSNDDTEGNGDKSEDEEDDSGSGDELASIKGIRPLVFLQDGEEKEIQSQSSSSTYKVKRTNDHYYCTCPAWRNQGGVPVNARSCKHLVALLGEKYEAARIKLKDPDGAALRSSKKTSSRKGKKSNDDTGASGSSAKSEVNVLLANTWDVDKGPDPTGWFISEKLDGVRTYYDGKRMYSRLGNPFTPPQWFLDKLPKDVTLDGELFGGRGQFQDTVSIVKTMNSPHWKDITFHVFDIPSIGTQPFESRIERLEKFFGLGGSHASDKVVLVEQEKAKSRQHVLDKLKEVESLGGEGLMLRQPGSQYEGKRSSTLLKIKSFYDAEAMVTGYKPGKGRNAGVTGALKCKMASGKTFDVGSGLNDKQRKNPPKIGTIIVYRFQELTKDGVPRFPTFLGEAADKMEPKDAIVPDHRKGAATKKSEE
ncbi:hypothetical protein GYMLUDRAFT_46330 [Collybiopsis luxurians FD-317 M1]|uniref:SWIM-type domain-containing protein n=1 Tax=Collybiopsis luxurians FD-317 M1 TaxID=944289 RepID=A0A0D0BQM8_9AGAR|nr:hypothetical protein GYMLUDRAFT_46330 [Collybiopsis luxurians FD-317 M1]